MQEIQWQYYPQVAELPNPRAFIESQAKRQKQPKTVDAYARNLEDLISAFAEFGVPDLVEAGLDDIETYIDWLHQRTPAKPRNKSTSSPGEGLSPNTIQQRIVTARLFYDFCIFRGYRRNTINPVPRGNPGYGDTPPQRGLVSHNKRLPWIPTDSEWERLVSHIMGHESVRNQLLILLAYDGALRREEVFNDIIERVRADVDLPALTTHTFRHLRCTILKRCGIDLQDIALYAGHKHVATTQIYIHLAPSELSKRLREATMPFDTRMERLIEGAIVHE